MLFHNILLAMSNVGRWFKERFGLPDGFVYVDTIDKSIQEQLRYNSNENFIGTVIDGYLASRAIMTEKASQALSNVQKEILLDGFSIVIYDSYRPQKAVDHFARWSKDPTENKTKEIYYPTIDKKDVFDLGYIAERSGHSRGSTVDLSIIALSASLKQPELTWRTLEDGSVISFLDDNTIDMGSSFDLMDEVSAHASVRVNASQRENRSYLLGKMQKHGFVMLDEEWWHYTLKDEPFPDTYFDFDVV
jgi:D-alanyl-D-alanine dipeptidase